ncbi:hypothetical protein MKW92_036204 [Papaver armeniacum]|nr:hypothetical protein MKW92_036204 [Papaver armeniacum]
MIISIPKTLVSSSLYITSKSFNLSQSQKYTSDRYFNASDGLSLDSSDDSDFIKKRNVVDHITLLKAKEGLSDEDEKDMLDHLYTSQYQMGGIIAISLGCVRNQNPDGYTHAVYMRFQGKEDLAKFYENTFYLGVLKDHVMPYCHVRPSITLNICKNEHNYGIAYLKCSNCLSDHLLTMRFIMCSLPFLARPPWFPHINGWVDFYQWLQNEMRRKIKISIYKHFAKIIYKVVQL